MESGKLCGEEEVNYAVVREEKGAHMNEVVDH